MSDRDYCIRRDFSSMRDIKRIDVICGLVKQLWINFRANDNKTGFFYITNLLELEADKRFKQDSYDPFYWEEDKWYDFMQELITSSKKLKQNFPLEETQEIKNTVEYFRRYWLIYPDFRFKQFLNVFDDLFEVRIREDILTDKFWKQLIAPEVVKHQERLAQLKKGYNNGN